MRNIKFLAKLGKNGREIFECLQEVYGDNSLKEPTVNKWLKRFREGREDVKDDQRSGRPSTSSSEENVERIRGCVLKDRRLTVRMIAEELSIPKTIVHEILTEKLEMKKWCAKIVPKLLTPEQKARRIGWKLHHRNRTPALFTRFSTLRLLPVPEMPNGAPGAALGGCRSHQG